MTSSAEVVFFAIGLGMSFVIAALAAQKGYDRNLWGFWGLLLWPVALGMILAKPQNPRLFRRCSDCGATDVPFDAPVCRHCGRDERVQVTA